MRKAPTAKPVRLTLDWRAYFLEFCHAHGDWYVVHRGVLLFPDGWTYSQTDYQGPEWPPPEDPKKLKALLRFYWLRRRAIIRHEFSVMENRVKGYKELQEWKSLPLQQTLTFRDESGKLNRKSEPMNLEGMELRLEWLKEDLKTCDDKLRELESGNPVGAGEKLDVEQQR